MDLLNIREELLTNMSPTKKPDQQSVWRAARSSGAAPTYFRASGRYIDGGLVANNPTLDILTEIHERNAALRCVDRAGEVEKVGVVVSLGTGDPAVEKVDHVDVFMYGRYSKNYFSSDMELSLVIGSDSYMLRQEDI